MSQWTLYVDESGAFADLSKHVLVAGVLWRHSSDEDLDQLKTRLREAVPQATWPWHARDLVVAASTGNGRAKATANEVFRALRELGGSLKREQTIEMLVAVETDRGDVIPPIGCRWRKLFRVLVERAVQILSMKDGKHALRLSAQWLPFMQQRPRNHEDFMSRNFLGSFQHLAQQALRGMPLVVGNARSRVTVDPTVEAATFAARTASVPVGHVLADFCAFQARSSLFALTPQLRARFGENFLEKAGVRLESRSHGTTRSHVAATGTFYCDTAWLTGEADVQEVVAGHPAAGATWLDEQRRQWHGALKGFDFANPLVFSTGMRQ